MCGIWIGAKGTGKTWSLVRLLKHYEDSPIIDKKGRKHEMRTILFCPTGNSNFAWDFFFSISSAVLSITLIFHKSFGGARFFLEASKCGS